MPDTARRRGAKPRRLRARHLVAVALAGWTVAAIVVPLSSVLPSALQRGSFVRRLHGELTLLGSGWTGQIDVPSRALTKGPYGWEWSMGPSSTIRVPPGWPSLSLDVRPAACPGGEAQRISFRGSGRRPGPVVVLHPGFHWYNVGLGFLRGGPTLSLTYRCVTQARGVHRAEEIAIAVAGLSVGRADPSS